MSDEKHEIVIIRRGGHGDHDEHHGGVWKIAFADFMTAMMAFFLVMWLISANDKTRASVARYFNPVRLVDATTQPRGLHDAKKDESGITASSDTKADKSAKDEAAGKDAKPAKDTKTEKDAKAETPAARQTRLDAALRDSPYVALAEIVATKGPEESASPPKAPSATIGRRGGEAFRDPFAPPPTAQADDDVAIPVVATATSTSTDADARTAKPDAALAAAPVVNVAPLAAKPDVKPDVKAVLAALNPPQAGIGGPQIEVRHTGEGLLVSFTDTADFSMFATGSAVPARKLVLMMERVATALKALKGPVVVRGFTDNKPFKSGRYDNWHLSLDRAQVSHYMLVRGGLDDGRIGHVEGYADRSAKSGTDPASPLNRRIEILVKDAS